MFFVLGPQALGSFLALDALGKLDQSRAKDSWTSLNHAIVGGWLLDLLEFRIRGLLASIGNLVAPGHCTGLVLDM